MRYSHRKGQRRRFESALYWNGFWVGLVSGVAATAGAFSMVILARSRSKALFPFLKWG